MLLTEENKKLTSELDKVSDLILFIVIEYMLRIQHCDRNHGYNFVFGAHFWFNTLPYAHLPIPYWQFFIISI